MRLWLKAGNQSENNTCFLSYKLWEQKRLNVLQRNFKVKRKVKRNTKGINNFNNDSNNTKNNGDNTGKNSNNRESKAVAIVEANISILVTVFKVI